MTGLEITLANQTNNIVILNPAPTLSGFDISSNNTRTNGTMARSGDTVTLNFTANQTINQPTVTFRSGGYNFGSGENISDNNVLYVTNDNINWSVSYSVNGEDTEGIVSFKITDITSTTNIAGLFDSGISSNSRFDKSFWNKYIDNPLFWYI